jgi:hypothetical protein
MTAATLMPIVLLAAPQVHRLSAVDAPYLYGTDFALLTFFSAQNVPFKVVTVDQDNMLHCMSLAAYGYPVQSYRGDLVDAVSALMAASAQEKVCCIATQAKLIPQLATLAGRKRCPLSLKHGLDAMPQQSGCVLATMPPKTPPLLTVAQIQAVAPKTSASLPLMLATDAGKSVSTPMSKQVHLDASAPAVLNYFQWINYEHS